MDKPFALIIDDDRDIVALFRHVLDMAGYRTEIVLHGRAAMERLSASAPDIVLLDLNLPGISGTNILHQIRSHEHLKGTQVVVITAYSHIAQTLEDEADLVLLKPVNIEQLIKLVERLRPADNIISEPAIDEDTGFYNHSFFKSRLEYSLAHLKQIDLSHFTVLLTDLGQFDTLVSQLGGDAVHRLVQDIAGVLKRVLRPTDTIAHFDGVKFAILIEDVRHWDIPIMLANRILTRIGEYLEERKIPNPVNIGIILCHVGYTDVEHILRDADTSLALAKAEGKSCYKFYAQDNLNNTYNLEMISDMISLVGAEPLRILEPKRSRGIRVRQIQNPQPNFSVLA